MDPRPMVCYSLCSTPPHLWADSRLRIQAALKEWVTGVQASCVFMESNNQESYQDHLAAMQMVKDLENSQSKHERLPSMISILRPCECAL